MVATSATADHVRASPAARKHASELDIDLTHVQGTGPHGVITIEDVDRAAMKPRAAPTAAATAATAGHPAGRSPVRR